MISRSVERLLKVACLASVLAFVGCGGAAEEIDAGGDALPPAQSQEEIKQSLQSSMQSMPPQYRDRMKQNVGQ
jgi:hypothetical protein